MPSRLGHSGYPVNASDARTQEKLRIELENRLATAEAKAAEARDMGYRVGILHSSDMGFGVYRRLVIVSELLCESVDLRANIAEERVLHTFFPLDPHAPPGLWGTQEGLAKLFGDNIASLCVVPRSVIYRFRSPEAYVDALQIGLG